MKELFGDLIDLYKEGKFDCIVHGCNLQQNMGAGLAKQIAREFPCVAEEDGQEKHILGDINPILVSGNIVINAYTQGWYGKPNNRLYRCSVLGRDSICEDSEKNRYKAIRECMRKINIIFQNKHIGLPLIGCGLAGGDWEAVKIIIKEELIDCDVTIVHYEKVKIWSDIETL